jgi:DNA repair protein SbcC/Rad50
MISKAVITYYQSHKKTILEFHNGVNVIIGSSDSGKSAIIRALRWLFENKPSGDKFKSHFGTLKTITSVKVYLDTGDVIIRRIKKGKNQYLINGKLLKAFGREAPEEVKTMLNLSDINLQLQLDNPFMLTETSGTVAKHFNKVANLDKIDEATSNIKKEITKINTSIAVQKEKLEEEQEKLKTFPNVEQLDLDLEKLEGLQKQRTQNAQTILRMELLLVDYFENKQKIKEAKETLQHEKKVDKVLQQIANRDKNKVTIDRMKLLIGNYEDNEQKIAENEEFLQSETIINNLLSKIALLNANKATVTTLNKLTVTYKANKQKVLKLEEKALQLEEQFHKYMPDICPLCETDLKAKNE